MDGKAAYATVTVFLIYFSSIRAASVNQQHSYLLFSFMLLVGRPEGHLTCKSSATKFPKVTFFPNRPNLE